MPLTYVLALSRIAHVKSFSYVYLSSTKAFFQLFLKSIFFAAVQQLINKKFESDKKADFFLSEIIRQRNKLNNSILRREKYNIIKEIKEKYDISQLFSSKVPNYKVFASLYKLFEGFSALNADEKTESYFIVIENVTTFNNKKTNDFMPKEMKDKD